MRSASIKKTSATILIEADQKSASVTSQITGNMLILDLQSSRLQLIFIQAPASTCVYTFLIWDRLHFKCSQSKIGGTLQER